MVPKTYTNRLLQYAVLHYIYIFIYVYIVLYYFILCYVVLSRAACNSGKLGLNVRRGGLRCGKSQKDNSAKAKACASAFLYSLFLMSSVPLFRV